MGINRYKNPKKTNEAGRCISKNLELIKSIFFKLLILYVFGLKYLIYAAKPNLLILEYL